MANSLQPVLLTKDLDKLLTFYTELLGAKQFDRVPEEGDAFYVGLQIGDGKLGLVAEGSDEAADAPQRILISVEVDNVDAMLDQVAAAGGKVVGGPNDMPWGQRVVHLHDPDGNTVNLTHEL